MTGLRPLNFPLRQDLGRGEGTHSIAGPLHFAPVPDTGAEKSVRRASFARVHEGSGAVDPGTRRPGAVRAEGSHSLGTRILRAGQVEEHLTDRRYGVVGGSRVRTVI